jgi:formate-dependent nitrite reductase membrane component NrfD
VTEEFRSYYGRAVIKEPTWTPEIPIYFFTGGLGGASAILSLAAEIAGNEQLAKTSRYLAAFGDNVSPFLLISDLGRPERFLNMLRVFKVTSPMSVGSWILVASGGASTTAAALEFLDRWKPVKIAAQTAAALFGGPLSTYTANLLSDTSVPIWHEGRRELPFVFGMSAGASAGAAATLFLRPRDAGPARRLAIGAAVAEAGIMLAMEKRLGMLAEPYHKGLSGKLSIASKVATLAGASVLVRGGRRSRGAAVAGSSLVLTGAMLLRWGVFKAGFASARDPKYTIVPQRRRVEAAQQQV